MKLKGKIKLICGIIFYSLPQPIRNFIRRIIYLPIDAMAQIRGEKNEFIPPRGVHSTFGDVDFLKTGRDFRELCINLGGLNPHMRMLEIGSGYGRIPVALTEYLTTGEYHGMDISAEAVLWCKKKIESRYPNFKFQHADIYNKQYNPVGKFQAVEYKFPFENGTFDFIFLGSVFTHMFPNDVDNYLKEISRLLKPQGRCFITYFILDKEASNLIVRKESSQEFIYKYENYFTKDPKTPERGIAFEEKYIRSLYIKHGLSIVEPIRFGSWSGRKDEHYSYQDIIVATRQTYE
jgi:SAM-dependent methyltransferase